jgi:outer membrane biosynthesis protein TonB
VIDRRDILGISLAVLGHAGLLAGIYFWPWGEPEDAALPMDPIQVSLSDDIGLVSAAPDPSTETPDEATAGQDVPEDSEIAPPEAEPEKKPDQPQPKPTQAANQIKPPPPRTNQTQRTQNPGGGRRGLELSDDTLRGNGPAREKTEGEGTKPPATMTGEAQQNILSAIKRQVQPCADRQVSPAAEAAQIVAVVQLKLNPNGSLASVRIVDHKGVNESNQRYVARVDDAVEAIFAGCTPIRGLPPELYDVPRGWKSLKFNYTLTN